MRTLAILLLCATAAYGQERTWTIATAVVTAEAELIAVRGDVVYLKMADKIESVPLARLSVADYEYISSLSLVPVRSGSDALELDGTTTPAMPQGGLLPAPAGGELPITEESIPLPGNGAGAAATGPGQGARTSNSRASAGTQAATRATAAPNSQRHGATTTAARRVAAPPTNQMQNNLRGNSNNNEPAGVLGIRGRRNNRQRGR
jgi:hypothetical protein